MIYAYLFIAILCDVIAINALKGSAGMTMIIPTCIMFGGFAASFFFLVLVLKVMPVGVTYAIWSGTGVCMALIIAAIYYSESLDFPAIMGMALIISGVIVINVFSKSVSV